MGTTPGTGASATDTAAEEVEEEMVAMAAAAEEGEIGAIGEGNSSIIDGAEAEEEEAAAAELELCAASAVCSVCGIM